MITRYRRLRLLTPRGVFAPRSDAGMLIDAARGHRLGPLVLARSEHLQATGAPPDPAAGEEFVVVPAHRGF